MLLCRVAVFVVLGVVDLVLQRFPAAQVLLVGAILLLVLAIAGYVGVVSTVFLLSALVSGHVDKPRTADVVVVLGSGLVRGEVPPLLRSRLDKGIEVWRRSVARGQQAVMIPSGGQGADEPRSEGEAMAEYLVVQGVPEAAVLPETRSRNTEENLRFSRTVQEEAGATGEVVIATSDHHVLRAAMLARSVGSEAEFVGACTARYYVPSAFLREFVAVVVAHRIGHAVVLVAVTALWGWVAVTAVI